MCCASDGTQEKTCENFSVWVYLAQNLLWRETWRRIQRMCSTVKHINLKSADVYFVSFVLNSPLGKSFVQLRETDKDGLHVKFRTNYHNVKNENACADNPGLLNMQKLTLPVPIPDKEKKITQIFNFTLPCGASNSFLKAFNTFIKLFEAAQRSVKIKI